MVYLRFLLFFLLICSAKFILAQPSQTIYFNEAGKATIKDQASYYSTITQIKKDTTRYTVSTFFISGNLKENGIYEVRNFPVIWETLYQLDFSNALKEGLFKEYYPNQQLKFEGKFRKGFGEGKHRRWYDNGQLLSETTLVNGREEGKVMSYYENGKPSTQYKASSGKIEGELVEYYTNGRKRSRATFSNGLLVGDIIYYDSKENEGPKKSK
ncbi:hypothetical protein AHMF7605_22690 [Adhaeribacter arboris]|uniref:Toxin-antitoxin system YwqK family antitoxin n=1 Tax=Adhaeribacter arboris TaxID=2072846 RepID=A0A2T2YKT0_9BACT|nr:hypothetical protein AHMF7605_22690 [Adhaeribacter arboris]